MSCIGAWLRWILGTVKGHVDFRHIVRIAWSPMRMVQFVVAVIGRTIVVGRLVERLVLLLALVPLPLNRCRLRIILWQRVQQCGPVKNLEKNNHMNWIIMNVCVVFRLKKIWKWISNTYNGDTPSRGCHLLEHWWSAKRMTILNIFNSLRIKNRAHIEMRR